MRIASRSDWYSSSQKPMMTIPSRFHMEANLTISSIARAFFNIIKYPLLSISSERALIAPARYGSSKSRPSYLRWSFTTTPIILESFCASRVAAILGIYPRSSSFLCTLSMVGFETRFVLPCRTFDTVAVLTPSSSAISTIRTLFSSHIISLRPISLSFGHTYLLHPYHASRGGSSFLWHVHILPEMSLPSVRSLSQALP